MKLWGRGGVLLEERKDLAVLLEVHAHLSPLSCESHSM